MGDKFGPRYASLKQRSVSGSITYYGNKKRQNKANNSTGLTLYFGGPFYFAMKNVEWSAPSIEIVPGGGYKHTYDFVARLPEYTKTSTANDIIQDEVKYFTNDFNQTVSEFSYSSYSFNIQQFLNDLSNLFKLN